jgi:hypothetical protein
MSDITHSKYGLGTLAKHLVNGPKQPRCLEHLVVYKWS